MRITLIAAMAANRTLGLDNKLPWRLPHDQRRFKRLTLGHDVVMGRKTFDSIRKPLPGRRNLVVTRQPDWSAPGVVVVHSVEEALATACGEEVFIVGGGEIYSLALPHADRIQLTRIDREYPGDAFFPEFDPADWRLVEREDHPATDETPAYSFLVYDRERRAAG